MKRCKVCYKKRFDGKADTCDQCPSKPGLSVDTCFRLYHTKRKYWKWHKFSVEVLNFMCNSLIHTILVSIANFWKMLKCWPFSRFWLAPGERVTPGWRHSEPVFMNTSRESGSEGVSKTMKVIGQSLHVCVKELILLALTNIYCN